MKGQLDRETELTRWLYPYLIYITDPGELQDRVAQLARWLTPYLMSLAHPDGLRDREAELTRWLEPYLSSIAHPAPMRICPLYIMRLLQASTRKCLQTISANFASATYDQLHHFIAGSLWDESLLEDEILNQANKVRGGPGSILVIHDIALLKRGIHSVGVSHQHSPRFCKKVNCQILVSFTLCRNEIPTPLAIRLFVPNDWLRDKARMSRAGVPKDFWPSRKKSTVTLRELKHILAAQVHFGTIVADIPYGIDPTFRRELTRLGLYWAVQVSWAQLVYPADVKLLESGATRYPKHPRPIPNVDSQTALSMLAASPLRPMQCPSSNDNNLALFAAQRVRIADGPKVGMYGRNSHHLPGDEFWLFGVQYGSGTPMFYLSNLPPESPPEQLEVIVRTHAATHTACQQLKYDLGLGEFEGRSWRGLHRHALMSLIAYQFLQHEKGI